MGRRNEYLHTLSVNSGERIPRRFCRGVSEQRNKKVLDGIGFLAGSVARTSNVRGTLPVVRTGGLLPVIPAGVVILKKG